MTTLPPDLLPYLTEPEREAATAAAIGAAFDSDRVLALLRGLAEARRAADWYGERASALARHTGASPPETEPRLAVVTELSLDAGRRAAAVRGER